MNFNQSFPLFGDKPFLLRGRLTAAVTARDGSGAITDLVRQDGKTFLGGKVYFTGTFDSSTDRCTVNVPDQAYQPLQVRTGMIFMIVSGTPPAGLSLNTEYQIIDLVVISATQVTFRVLDLSNWAVVDITTTGSNCVLAVHIGSRLDRVRFNSAQATPAATSALVVCVYVSDSNQSNYRKIADQLVTAVTTTNALAGAYGIIGFSGGLIVPTNCKIGVSQTVYAGAQDQFDVIGEGADL